MGEVLQKLIFEFLYFDFSLAFQRSIQTINGSRKNINPSQIIIKKNAESCHANESYDYSIR